MFWRLLLSSTELRMLGLNLTIEFQVVFRRHIVKFCFFCDIYSPDFARGIKIPDNILLKGRNLHIYESGTC